ncbi:beta-glucosidase 11 isoform X2 [Spinacia oleracea]|uniref:Beta-glucosidase 11 isoform X2 n=1 Tax=Spinacia oleracea TaxID=3562 RepID=A0A9R0J2H2_SPIOL|nr:beta-glucosidase 11-like isoform X2 [Spinacia oleracea]
MQRVSLSLYLLLLNYVLINLAGEFVDVRAKVYNRNDFPPHFIFGAGTSSYQVEGAAFEDGRKASIFDTFAHSGGCSTDGGNRIRCLSFLYLMVKTKTGGPVNPKGVEYYNNLINELVSHGIQPHVTLLHLDTPQALEDKYGGFLHHNIVEDFTAYADVCFREFGDRVQYWTSINEANIFIMGGYDSGDSPPGRCSLPFGRHCIKGNSTTEPYIAAHNVLLAHASAARLYRDKYKAKQHGFLGFSLYLYHFIPAENTTEDVMAAQRVYDFFIGLFMDPLTYGDYPAIVKKNAGRRIPAFTQNQSELVKGSSDFIGVNFYNVVSNKHTNLKPEARDYLSDMAAEWKFYNQSSDIRETDGLPALPWGLKGGLEYFKNVYGNPPIYIHENGQLTNHNVSVNDQSRIDYLQVLINGVLEAVRNGSNTKAYFVWSFIDLFEVLFSYSKSFGLYYVDFNDPNRPRYPKLSQKWYSGFLGGENVTVEDEAENKLTILGTSPNNMDDRFSS